MAYSRPDLSNLRMESIDDFLPTGTLSSATKSPTISVSKSNTPPPEKNNKSQGGTLDRLRSSLSSSMKTPSRSSSKTSPLAIRQSTPPPERNNNPYGSTLDFPRSPLSSTASVTPPLISRTSTPPTATSNNPYTSNNPWLSSASSSNSNLTPPPSSRPDISRYKSYSLDLPRLNPSPTATQTEVQQVDSTRNSVSLVRPDEDTIAASFGLGHIHDVKEFVEYAVMNASLTNMRVCPLDLSDKDGKYFYVAHRSFLPNRPGVIIHSGTTKEGAVVAVGHLDYFSTSNSLGIGNPEEDPMSVIWEKMHKESFWTHMRYSFEWDVDVERKGLKEVERHVFEWHRTKNNFLWDDQGDLVLVEKGRDEVLALYEGKGPLGQLPGKHRGTLRIKPKAEGFKEGWEMMVLLGWASVVELSRRRARSRRISSIVGHI